MVMDHEIIIFTPIFLLMIGFTVFRILKKRKRSAKSIYKLIDDLEKNTFINFFYRNKYFELLEKMTELGGWEDLYLNRFNYKKGSTRSQVRILSPRL